MRRATLPRPDGPTQKQPAPGAYPRAGGEARSLGWLRPRRANASGDGGGGWSCCGDGREAVAAETHPCPHGQSQRPRLMHSRLGGVGGRP